MTDHKHYDKRTLRQLADDIQRLNEIGVTKGAARVDSEWFSTHPLASVDSATREKVAGYLRHITPAGAVTATSYLVAPNDQGIPHQLLVNWATRFPADTVITQTAEDPLTLCATWTEKP